MKYDHVFMDKKKLVTHSQFPGKLGASQHELSLSLRKWSV